MWDRMFLGNSVEQWLLAVAIVIGAGLVGRLAGLGFLFVTRRLRSALLTGFAGEIGGPLTTLALTFGARIASESLALPDGAKHLIAQAATFVTVVAMTWLIVKFYDAVHERVLIPYASRPETTIEVHLFSVLHTVLVVFVWLVGLASALSSVGFEITAILASLGIGGMALALASQDTVSNFFGGLLVLTQRPFKVGDRIEIAGINGWVQDIGLRSTMVRNWYGRDVFIPNKKFTDNTVINIDSQSVYFEEARMRLDPRTTAAESDQALKILADVVQDVEPLDETSWIMFHSIGHGYFELEFWYAIPRWSAKDIPTYPNEYDKICRVKSAVNLQILRRFEAAGIRLAVPMEAHLRAEWPEISSRSSPGPVGGPPRGPAAPGTA